MGDLVGVEEGERTEAKLCLCNLQESCCTKRRKVPERVPEAAGMAAKLVDDGAPTSSPGTSLIVDPRFCELTGQLASTTQVSLKSK